MTPKLQDRTISRTILLSDQEYLFFGGTAYLGLNHHIGFKELFIEGLNKYGLNNGTSRTNNVQLDIYTEAENHAAIKFGFEDAILVSSGYLAAQLAVQNIGKNAIICYSPSCHPALHYKGSHNMAAYSKPNSSFNEWAAQTIDFINSSTEDNFVIISNTLDNVIPTRHSFTEFDQILPHKQVHFILDDSHGLGVFDPDQSSIHHDMIKGEWTKPNIKLTVVASMAKGLGIDAGIILGDQNTIGFLRKKPMYIGASPSAPAFLHAFVHGEEIYKQQWQKLQHHIDYFSAEVPQEFFRTISHYPVFQIIGFHVDSDQSAFKKLIDNKVMISSFPYPDPNDKVADRIVLSAAHQQEDLEKLIKIFTL